MARALYLTHPQVKIDPSIPTPLWELSEIGRARAQLLAACPALRGNCTLFSSTERKALDLAQIIADAIGAPIVADPAFGENDRSATGFLPPPLFEATADRFFAEPGASIDGWERAVDAQVRIVTAVGIALANTPPDRVAVFCGHGAVGTLLKCHVSGRPIARTEDQGASAQPGGGNIFAFDFAAPALIFDWVPFEAFAGEAIAQERTAMPA